MTSMDNFENNFDMDNMDSVVSGSDFPPSQAAEVFNSGAVTPQNIHAMDTFESTSSDVISDLGPAISYTINDDNKWGWITLYVVTIVVAVIGNLLFIIGSLCTRRSRNTGHYLLINLSIRWEIKPVGE